MFVSPLEMAAAFFTLMCVGLTVVRNIWCWPTGIIGVSLYFLLFFENKLYADMCLQVVFFSQSIYGWYYWLYGKKKYLEDEVPIRKLALKEILFILGGILVMAIGIGTLFSLYTDADVPYFDSSLASISLIANMLLARKILDNWYLWIFADFFYIFLFTYKGLYLSAGLYTLFFFMAIAGLLKWQKDYQRKPILASKYAKKNA